MDANQIELIGEQLRHALDLLRAELDSVRAQQTHDRSLAEQRLHALEEARGDHETRLRQATEGVTRFQVWSGLTSGGSGLMALAALLKAFFGV